ncbi:MAG: hypothetical protein IPP85_06955 [Propionivibrio sp.]|nr:hypothetical protein [Propionivibrio sp.]
MSDQDVLDADAAAELLDIHLVTLRRLALAGRIPEVRARVEILSQGAFREAGR